MNTLKLPVFGISQITPRLGDLPGGLKDPAYGHTHSYDLLQQKDGEENQQIERCMGPSPEETRHQLS